MRPPSRERVNPPLGLRKAPPRPLARPCGLRKIYDAVPDDAVRAKALELIETEADAKYRKKYAGVWKGVPAVR